MRKWWIKMCVFASLTAVALFAAGCGDDDEGNGSSELTKDEQLEVITQYITFDPDDPGALDVTNYALELLSGQYWDGIDTADVVGIGKRVAPLAKMTTHPMDAESLFVDYNFVTGWWVIYFDVTVSDEFSEFSVTARDSIRFADAEGDPQFEPDENTHRIDLASQVVGRIASGAGGLAAHGEDHLVLESESASRFAITKVGDDLAQVDGDAVAELTLDASVEDTALTIGIGLDAGYSELVVPVANFQGEPCPTSGEVTAGMDIAIALEKGDSQAEAEGSWDASVEFVGDGNVTLHVESGDFSEDYAGQTCEPPQE
jgi:hypothetical protein